MVVVCLHGRRICSKSKLYCLCAHMCVCAYVCKCMCYTQVESDATIWLMSLVRREVSCPVVVPNIQRDLSLLIFSLSLQTFFFIPYSAR